MTFKLRIALPPDGTLMRNLVFTTIPVLADSEGFQDADYSDSLDEYSLFFTNEYAAEEAFEKLFQLALDVVTKKRKAKIRDRGLHRNDNQWISKLIGGQEGYLAAANNLIEHFREEFEPGCLSIRSTTRSKEVYGCSNGATYSLIQPLKIEHYEYGSGWLKSVGGGVKGEVRLDLNWYVLLMAGYILSYAGIIDDEMIFITPEEAWVAETIAKKQKFWIPYRKILGEFGSFLYGSIEKEGRRGEGIVTRMASLNVPLEPKHAYLIYVASDLAISFKGRRIILKTLRLGFTRIAGGGRTFTLLERAEADLAPLIMKISRLYEVSEGGRAAECLRNIARKTLFYRRSALARYGDYHRFTSHFYEYLHQAYDPYVLIYEAARGRVGEYEKCLGDILRAIIRIEQGVYI